MDLLELDVVPGLDTEPGAGGSPLDTAGPEVRLARDPNGTWYVLWRADVEALLHDRRLQGIGLSVFDLLGITEGPLREWYRGIMFTNEGDVHHRLRSLVQKAFTPRAIEALRPVAAAESGRLLAPIVHDGKGDLVELAFHLPIRVMAVLLGVPARDVPVFTGWSADLARVFGYMTPAQIDAATDALVHLQTYVAALLDERRHDPGDDLISALLAAEDEGDRLTHDEVISMVVNLLVGGHDTSTSQIACSLLALLSTPGALTAVADDPSLAASAAEETIRHLPGIGAVPRVTTKPIEIGSHTIPAGTLVLLSSHRANHDASAFDDPDHLDVARYDARHGDAGAPAARVLSFGAGPHYCLGAAMARMLVQEAVAAVAALPGHPELTEPADAIPWRRVLGEYPSRLPVHLA